MADNSAKVEEVRREGAGLKAQPSECRPNVKKDLTNLKQELAKLKEEIRELQRQKAAMADERLRLGGRTETGHSAGVGCVGFAGQVTWLPLLSAGAEAHTGERHWLLGDVRRL
jgi:hypothetical protein